MNDINDVLKDRAKTHGQFSELSIISQGLKRVAFSSKNKFSDVQREALSMILHKIARICSGNSEYRDHWVDIMGYAKLALNDDDKNEICLRCNQPNNKLVDSTGLCKTCFEEA